MEIIIGKTAGFCYGVNRAVEGCKKVLKENNKDKVYCLGEIVHNKRVIENLKREGLEFIDDIENAKGTTIIRAHGVQKEIYDKADKNKILIKDFTCPNVLKIHDIAKEYSKKGYFIMLCGSKIHPENIGTLSYCGKNFYVIEKESDAFKAIEKLKTSEIKKVLLISQTTYSLEEFFVIREILENEIDKDIEFISNNTICRATELRQEETSKIASVVDYMIIIGGKNSSNTRKLYNIAKEKCNKAICVEGKNELDFSKIKKYEKIGIMAGASTPKESINEIVEELTRQ